MSTYYIVRGLPGVGKTTLLNGLHLTNIIDPDSIKLDGLSRHATSRYRKNLEQAIYSINSSQNFYWTQPWSKMWGIDTTIKNLELETKTGRTPRVVVVTIVAPYLLCYIRYYLRKVDKNKMSCWKYYRKYIAGFEKFDMKGVEHYYVNNIFYSSALKQLRRLV